MATANPLVKSVGNKQLHRINVAATKTGVLELAGPGPSTIVVAPGVGGSATIEFTCSIPGSDRLWVPAYGLGAGGVVTDLMMDTITTTIAAIRVTATTADARVEVAL